MKEQVTTVSSPNETIIHKVRCAGIYYSQPNVSYGRASYEASLTCKFDKITGFDLFDKIIDLIPDGKVETFTNSKVFIYSPTIGISADYDGHEGWKVMDRHVTFYLFGTPSLVRPLLTHLNDMYASDKEISVNWVYQLSNGSLESRDFYLTEKGEFHKEFYPYLDDIDGYIDAFDKSSANILILMGPPGTGKTSFLKHFLHRVKCDATTTYDQEVMKKDSLYVDFLNSQRRYLILEDSDILLLSRERDDNRVMSKILNASDGLVSTDKKFIFTANLTNPAQIDEALTRPGRCYDVRNFRQLTRNEAEIVAEKLNKTLPEKEEYSLAEIFNGTTVKPKKMGFGFGR